mmetsp:Transcript_133036/g.370872  ORF Transcript_133036/g.370872 Transcript_133036/m.370872 type:complete len:217 (+) Transcript_133036:1680-2330(+)
MLAPLMSNALTRAWCRPSSSVWEYPWDAVCNRPVTARGCFRRSLLLERNISYFRAASRSTTRTPDTSGASTWSRLLPWCFASTEIALRRLPMACAMSFSSSLNSAAAFSRMAIAVFKASVSFEICSFRSVISVAKFPNLALRLSISELSSRSLDSASATAWVFSFSVVAHQHTILSYMADSWSASARSSASILPRSPTTRLTGFFHASSSAARPPR